MSTTRSTHEDNFQPYIGVWAYPIGPVTKAQAIDDDDYELLKAKFFASH